ncbi:MAG: AsmA family protein [Rhodocyclales bacterium]|nr:AsmA family protein [Rhodocyclales bacterium]
MSLLVRATGFLLGMLATALAAVMLYISATFNDKQIGIDTRDFVESEYERTWSTDSDIHLALWPWPSLQIGPANLSEPNRQQAFASWKKASFELDALALLRHKLVIRHARIEGLTLRLARDGKGVWNAADLLGDDPDVDSPVVLRLEGLALGHASVVVEDAISGRSMQWRDLELGTDAWGANRGGRVQLISQLVSPAAGLEGKLSVSARYRFGETQASGTLSAAQLHYVGSIGAAIATDITLGFGSIDWKNDKWDLADAHVRGSGKLGTQALELTAAVPEASWHEALQTRNASAQLNLLSTEKQGAQGELHLVLQDLLPGGKNISSGRLEGGWQVQSGDRATQGQLRAQLRHDAQAKQIRLDMIAGDASFTHPALNSGNAHASLQGSAIWHLSAPVDTARGELDLDAAFGKDVLHAAASLATDSATATPVITARLDSKRFDVDRLLAAGPHPIELPVSEALHGWMLDGIVHATELRFAGMHMSSLNLPVKIGDGRLTLAGHEIGLYGGKLAGSISYDAEKQDLTIFETLREVQLDALAHDAQWSLPFDGLTNATLDVHSHGAELQAMPDTAKGVLRLYAKNARWLGVDLPRNVQALHAGKPATNSLQAATQLAELAVAFTVNGPQLVVDKLTAHSNALSLTGNGNIQYASRQMDLLLNTHLGNDKALADLRGKRMSLRVKGRLMQPQLAIEVQQASVSH